MDYRVEPKIHLILTQEEALWLKAQLQNPLHNQSPSEETPQDAEMRGRFFEALKDSLR
ncbi:MAG: hypothetical protein PHV11_08685 [Candidatus Bipolaricaulis sp.]|nr:hypothetical protein [Candidatus Bipolaricaulis sp.]